MSGVQYHELLGCGVMADNVPSKTGDNEFLVVLLLTILTPVIISEF